MTSGVKEDLVQAIQAVGTPPCEECAFYHQCAADGGLCYDFIKYMNGPPVNGWKPMQPQWRIGRKPSIRKDIKAWFWDMDAGERKNIYTGRLWNLSTLCSKIKALSVGETLEAFLASCGKVEVFRDFANRYQSKSARKLGPLLHRLGRYGSNVKTEQILRDYKRAYSEYARAAYPPEGMLADLRDHTSLWRGSDHGRTIRPSGL